MSLGDRSVMGSQRGKEDAPEAPWKTVPSAHVPGSSQLAAFLPLILFLPASSALLVFDVMAVSSAASTSPSSSPSVLDIVAVASHQPLLSALSSLSPTCFPSTAPLPPRQPFFHLHLRLSLSPFASSASSSSSLFPFASKKKQTKIKRE